jgi:hypothetical protein
MSVLLLTAVGQAELGGALEPRLDDGNLTFGVSGR